mmetsp:Transcript_58801/g.140175  ORF Transcript_58801/g.140175 Transcript_58801/m.140175 type:complete len:174 (-) Transcript_58801:90-611(-)
MDVGFSRGEWQEKFLAGATGGAASGACVAATVAFFVSNPVGWTAAGGMVVGGLVGGFWGQRAESMELAWQEGMRAGSSAGLLLGLARDLDPHHLHQASSAHPAVGVLDQSAPAAASAAAAADIQPSHLHPGPGHDAAEQVMHSSGTLLDSAQVAPAPAESEWTLCGEVSQTLS